jgi:hypothetical protein
MRYRLHREIKHAEIRLIDTAQNGCKSTEAGRCEKLSDFHTIDFDEPACQRYSVRTTEYTVQGSRFVHVQYNTPSCN